jgi:MFS family permease
MILVIGEVALKYFNVASTVLMIFYIASIGSSVAGSFLSYQIRRLNLLYFWMILGTVSSFFPVIVPYLTAGQYVIIFLFLGISLGLGIPSCFAFFAEFTKIENRGHVSALIFSIANFSVLIFTLLFMIFDLSNYFLFLAIWRGLGLLLFVLLKPEERNRNRRNRTSFAFVFHDRSFILYFIAWVMFTLIDSLEKSILRNFVESNFGRLILIIQPIIASFAMLIAGLLSDKIGRKRVTIYGFVSLGIAYAIIGIAPTLRISWYLYLAIDGIAAGILWLIFILIIWGDLSSFVTSEKYYLVGNLPTLARNITSLLPISFGALIPINATFSLASFFLFLAVLPLMYAPETLPERKIRLRQLKSYVEAAKKVREKYLKKTAGRG